MSGYLRRIAERVVTAERPLVPTSAEAPPGIVKDAMPDPSDESPGGEPRALGPTPPPVHPEPLPAHTPPVPDRVVDAAPASSESRNSDAVILDPPAFPLGWGRPVTEPDGSNGDGSGPAEPVGEQPPLSPPTEPEPGPDLVEEPGAVDHEPVVALEPSPRHSIEPMTEPDRPASRLGEVEPRAIEPAHPAPPHLTAESEPDRRRDGEAAHRLRPTIGDETPDIEPADSLFSPARPAAADPPMPEAEAPSVVIERLYVDVVPEAPRARPRPARPAPPPAPMERPSAPWARLGFGLGQM